MGYLNVTSDPVPASRRPQKRLASPATVNIQFGLYCGLIEAEAGFLGMEGNIRPSTCKKQTLVKLEVMASVLERSTFLFAILIEPIFDKYHRSPEAVTSILTKVRL